MSPVERGHGGRRLGTLLATVVVATVAVGSAALFPGTPTIGGGGGGGAITCDQESVNASDLSSDLAAISSGETLCLTNAVNYGTFDGTSKNITIIAQSGSGPTDPVNATIDLNLGSGDSGFTIDGSRATWAATTGLTIGGGLIEGASDVTIKNSAFNDILDIEGVNDNIVLDNNTLDWNSVSGGINAKIFLGDTGRSHSLAAPAATIKNSFFSGGELDGIHIGEGGGGYLILNNEFTDLCDVGSNHTDNIQVGANSPRIYAVRIAGNYIHEDASCETQGISSYDDGTDGFIIENNIVDTPTRAAGIELYGDLDSIVRHNTIVYYSGGGYIAMDRKAELPAGSGTHAYDNVAIVSFDNGSTGTEDHNVSGQTAVYVGPTTSHDGFLLDPSSPVGINAASDGTDAGICAASADASC